VSLQNPFEQQNGIFLTDFDGTMTRVDFYDVVLRRFPQIAARGFWQRYEQGQISHFQAMQGIYGQLRASSEEMADILREMELDPELPAAVWKLERSDWVVKVVSGGGEWYILDLLEAAGVTLEVHANPGRFDPEHGLVLRLPEDSPFFSPTVGIDKAAAVRQALDMTSRVAYAGDGRPDLEPALLVPPHLRFARGWLADTLRSRGEPFHPFEHWSEIAERLLTAG
jgi:2-hydroxy-3-keto-5-methylthiopentenyl-1-phosphate phosphatase